MKLMYLIYSWIDLKPGCEFTDCICFPHRFQTLFINCLFLIPCSWLCKWHKISDMALDSYFKQEVGLTKPLVLNFLERNRRGWLGFLYLFFSFFRQYRPCQSHHYRNTGLFLRFHSWIQIFNYIVVIFVQCVYTRLQSCKSGPCIYGYIWTSFKCH